MQYTIGEAQITFSIFFFKSQFAYYLGTRTCFTGGTNSSKKQLFASLSACDWTGCVQGFWHSCHTRSSPHSNRHHFSFIKSGHVYVHAHTKLHVYIRTYSSPILYFHRQALPHPLWLWKNSKRATVLTGCALTAPLPYLCLCGMSSLLWNGSKSRAALALAKKTNFKKGVHVNKLAVILF